MSLSPNVQFDDHATIANELLINRVSPRENNRFRNYLSSLVHHRYANKSNYDATSDTDTIVSSRDTGTIGRLSPVHPQILINVA